MGQANLLGMTAEQVAELNGLKAMLCSAEELREEIEHYLRCKSCRLELQLLLERYPNRVPFFLASDDEGEISEEGGDAPASPEDVWHKLNDVTPDDCLDIKDFIVRRLNLAKELLAEYAKQLELRIEEVNNTRIFEPILKGGG